jgi:hypothetical protein
MEKRSKIIADLIYEVRNMDKDTQRWLRGRWRKRNNNIKDAEASIYEMAVELAIFRGLIER